jgi:uroporphyrinogen decarboxylase
MLTQLSQSISTRTDPLAVPIGVYAGLELIGATVYEAVTDATVQAKALLALQERFQPGFLITAMDLSAEAEAFGCKIQMPEDEIPTVLGRLVSTIEQARDLRVPHAGDMRTAVHLETARQLAATQTAPVLGGCIGPFSLTGRLFGVSEALEATILEPNTINILLEKTTSFLIDYVLAFRAAGAAGVIMAEPVAGLLSPRGLGKFSAPFVKKIVDAVQTPAFTLILHNCGAKINHLSKILESGAEIYHFGEPMDMSQALQLVDGNVILGGNLDPFSVFFQGTREHVSEKTTELLTAVGTYKNFFLSSGCDLPPHVPLENLAAFFSAAANFQLHERDI